MDFHWYLPANSSGGGSSDQVISSEIVEIDVNESMNSAEWKGESVAFYEANTYSLDGSKLTEIGLQTTEVTETPVTTIRFSWNTPFVGRIKIMVLYKINN